MPKLTNIVIALLISLSWSCGKTSLGEVDVDTEIMEEMGRLGIPSVVACSVDSNGIRWTGNYGYANIEYSIPAADETIYCLMSISKLFLSITIFQLWEAELLELDADINTYLPFDVRNPSYLDSAITVSMLLNHTSGLTWPRDDEYFPDFHHFYSHEKPPLLLEWLPEYILPGGASYKPYVWKDFAPGEKYLYSNIGASLLGLIVEQISGMDYRDYCREKILDPLGMTNSSFYLDELDYDFIATPYNNQNGPMYFYTCRHYPAGFLNCSTIDFARFVQACINMGSLDGNIILKEVTMLKMLEIQNMQSGGSNLWDNYIGGTVGHIGGGTGFSTCVEMDIENKTALFLFSNKVNSSVYPKGRLFELVKYQSYLIQDI